MSAFVTIEIYDTNPDIRVFPTIDDLESWLSALTGNRFNPFNMRYAHSKAGIYCVSGHVDGMFNDVWVGYAIRTFHSPRKMDDGYDYQAWAVLQDRDCPAYRVIG